MTNENEVLIVRYTGKNYSTNKVWAGNGGWQSRWNNEKSFSEKLGKLIEKANSDSVDFDKFGVVVFFNSRVDTDNAVTLEKIFVDTLKKEGIIIDDNKKYFRILCVVPDETLPSKTYDFYIFDGYSDFVKIVKECLIGLK